jgi:hypothetical protein
MEKQKQEAERKKELQQMMVAAKQKLLDGKRKRIAGPESRDGVDHEA